MPVKLHMAYSFVHVSKAFELDFCRVALNCKRASSSLALEKERHKNKKEKVSRLRKSRLRKVEQFDIPVGVGKERMFGLCMGF